MKADFVIAVLLGVGLTTGLMPRIGFSAAFIIGCAYCSLYLLIARDK